MTVLGAQLCDELKISFEDAFSQQFLLSSKPDLALPGFHTQAFSGRWLYTGKTAPVAQAKGNHENECGITVLGRAVDDTGFLVTTRRLTEVLKSIKDLSELERYIERLGGRYIVFLHWKKIERIYTDPSGSMGVLVNRDNGLIGSTLYMVITRDVIPTTEYPAELHSSRFAFGHTADRDVFALTPNHYYDLNANKETRFWPREHSFNCTTLDELDDGIEQVVHRHGQIIRALSLSDGPLILAMSGGQDSRILLSIAASEGIRPDFLFSHITNQNTQTDAQIGAQLCASVGWDMEKIDTFSEDRNAVMAKWKVYEYMRASAVARGSLDYRYETPMRKHRILRNEMIATRALPEGGCLLRGHVTDISKAVLWRRVGMDAFIRGGADAVDVTIGARLLYHDQPQLGATPFVQENYSRWFKDLPEGARARSLDFMGIELYRNYSLGNGFYGLNHNFYMAPGCDRLIIEKLAAAPPLLRAQIQYNHRMIAKTTPALNDAPYTRVPDNTLINNMRPVESNLALYGLN